MAQGGNPPTNLTDSHIYVGNSSNVPTDVAMSGDVTITNTGAATIKTDVALAGNPTTTTQAAADNSTKIATTAFVIANAVTDTGSTCVDNTLRRADGTTGKITQKTGIVCSDNDELSLFRYNELADSTTARTLDVTIDEGGTITFSNAATVTVTLPKTLPKGFACTLVQGGTGQVQLTLISGATLRNSTNWTATRTQYSIINLEVVSNSDGNSAIYYLSGDGAIASTTFSSPILNSIQQVSITIAAGSTSNTATITSVSTTKSYCHYQGATGQVAVFAADTCLADVTLTNATTVTATRNTSDASNSVTVNCTVVEFVSAAIQSIQQGTIAIGSAATSNTATITAVTAANAVVHFNGSVFNSTTDNANFARCLGTVALTNTTTVTAARNTASTSTLTVRFVVVEFAAGILNSATQSVASAAAANTFSTAVDSRYSLIFYGGFSTTTTTTSSSSALVPFGLLPKGYIAEANVSGSATIRFMVAEFNATSIKRIERCRNVILANNTTQTTIIPSADTVNTQKTLVNWLGFTNDGSLTTFRDSWGKVTLTDANTVTCSRNTAHVTAQTISGFEIVEFN